MTQKIVAWYYDENLGRRIEKDAPYASGLIFETEDGKFHIHNCCEQQCLQPNSDIVILPERTPSGERTGE